MYTLIESELYSHQAALLGDIERLDDALTGVTWAISILPEEFPPLRGLGQLRVAKSERLRKGTGFVQIRVWFAIRDTHHVELPGIDYAPLPS
jgi:hypothetical protein